jgi:hypothetical protein
MHVMICVHMCVGFFEFCGRGYVQGGKKESSTIICIFLI